MKKKRKLLLSTIVMALALVVFLPFYIFLATDNNGTGTISGVFTVINPAHDVTIQLRQGASVVSTTVVHIVPANTEEPAGFMFNSLPGGTYDLVFSQPGHTQLTFNNVIVADGPVSLGQDANFPSQLPLRPGNITGSGQVNISDLNVLLQNWLGDYENANFTGSGQVNIADLNLLLSNWMAVSVIAYASLTGGQTPTPSPTSAPSPTPSESPIPGQSPQPSPSPSVPPTPTPMPSESPIPLQSPSPLQSPPPEGLPQSGITLPNRRLTDAERAEWIDEYWAMGGPYAFELEIARLINEVRGEHNLEPVQVDYMLMMSARFYVQQKANLSLPLGHNQGPYMDTAYGATHGAAANITEAFGVRLRWNGGNGASGHMSAASLVSSWMDSQAHSNFILSPEHRFIGIGSHTRGATGAFHYLLLNDIR